MRTESMSRAREFLVGKWGESYGQTKWVECLQLCGLMPTDEVNEAMRRAVVWLLTGLLEVAADVYVISQGFSE